MRTVMDIISPQRTAAVGVFVAQTLNQLALGKSTFAGFLRRVPERREMQACAEWVFLGASGDSGVLEKAGIRDVELCSIRRERKSVGVTAGGN